MSFYQADEKDPWMYIWVGFAGERAEEYVKSMGISPRHPVFHSEQSDELYSIVRDMMDHNTVGVANELRRNGLLHIFLSVVAQSMPEERREETDRANQYVRRAVEFIQRNYCNPIRVTDVAVMSVSTAVIYILCFRNLSVCPRSSFWRRTGDKGAGNADGAASAGGKHRIVLRISGSACVQQGVSADEGGFPDDVSEADSAG